MPTGSLTPRSSVLNDEQVVAFEVFGPDDLAAARARFAELTADDPVPG
jgi:hypothetical protein